MGCALAPASAGRAAALLVIIPEGPRTLDGLLLVFGAGDLPIAAAVAQIGDIPPPMLAMLPAQPRAEAFPGLLDGDLGDVADLELAGIVDGTGDHRSVLVDRHGVVAPGAGDPEVAVVHD